MIKFDACEMSDMIKDEFGREFNIPYSVMEDQRRIEIEVSYDSTDIQWNEQNKKILEEFVSTGESKSAKNNRELLDALTSCLCERGKLKEGEYLLKFDD